MNAPATQAQASGQTLGHDAAASLLQISPDQLTKLVGSGAVRLVAPGRYAPAQILRDYIAHLHREPERRERAPTQTEIAAHLDMSDRNLRDVLTQLGLEHKQVTLAEIRVGYIRRLRDQAAGRLGSSTDLDLVQERAALAREQRERVALQNAATRGELAPIELLRDVLAKAIAIMVSELDQVDGLIAQTAPELPDATRVAVLNAVAAARNKIAVASVDLVLADVDPADDVDFDADDEGAHP